MSIFAPTGVVSAGGNQQRFRAPPVEALYQNTRQFSGSVNLQDASSFLSESVLYLEQKHTEPIGIPAIS